MRSDEIPGRDPEDSSPVSHPERPLLNRTILEELSLEPRVASELNSARTEGAVSAFGRKTQSVNAMGSRIGPKSASPHLGAGAKGSRRSFYSDEGLLYAHTNNIKFIT